MARGEAWPREPPPLAAPRDRDGGGWRPRPNDLCRGEVGFLYLGKQSHQKKKQKEKKQPPQRGQASAPCAQVAPRAAGPSRGLLPDKPHSPGKPPAACCLEPRPRAQGGAPAPSQVTAGSVTSANWMCLVGLPDVDRNVLFFVFFEQCNCYLIQAEHYFSFMFNLN